MVAPTRRRRRLRPRCERAHRSSCVVVLRRGVGRGGQVPPVNKFLISSSKPRREASTCPGVSAGGCWALGLARLEGGYQVGDGDRVARNGIPDLVQVFMIRG